MAASPLPADVSAILSFWFGANALSAPAERKQWFSKDTAFDAAILSRFLPVYRRGVAGELESWRESAPAALAYVLLFDQFPRNMFRGSPEAFASDAKALSCAKAAVAAGFDVQTPPLARVFFYLPFEHGERLADQRYSVKLYSRLASEAGMAGYLDYAKRHADVIERFGRFPHRNQILGRVSTPEETAFLQEPGSAF